MPIEINLQQASNPQSEAKKQLENIHTMMTAAHQSIRLEQHSLVYWGIAGGLLCACLPYLIESISITDYVTQALVILLIEAPVLALAAILDFRKTKLIRQNQKESIPFVQKQVTKIWWLIIGLGLAMDFGLHIFGGSFVELSLWMFLIGLTLMIHGFFSSQPLGRFGILMVAFAIVTITLPFQMMNWFAASVFGFGLPMLGYLLHRNQGHVSFMQLLLWVGIATLPGLAIATVEKNMHQATLLDANEIPVAEYQTFVNSSEQKIVFLPRGSEIPLTLSIKSNVLEENKTITLPLTLGKDFSLTMASGKPNGSYRIADEPWKNLRDGLAIRLPELEFGITKEAGLAGSMTIDVQAGL